jgi:hypothetical protein
MVHLVWAKIGVIINLGAVSEPVLPAAVVCDGVNESSYSDKNERHENGGYDETD